SAAVTIEQQRLRIGPLLDQCYALARAKHEQRLRERLRERGIGGHDERLASARERFAAARIEHVAIAPAAYLVPLPERRGNRERSIAQREDAHEATVGAAREQAPALGVRRASDRPGAALAEAQQRRIDAGPEPRARAIERIALCHAAEV